MTALIRWEPLVNALATRATAFFDSPRRFPCGEPEPGLIHRVPFIPFITPAPNEAANPEMYIDIPS